MIMKDPRTVPFLLGMAVGFILSGYWERKK